MLFWKKALRIPEESLSLIALRNQKCEASFTFT